MLIIWSIGFLTGFLLFLAAVALFFFKLILYPNLQRKLPEIMKPKRVKQTEIKYKFLILFYFILLSYSSSCT
jgi:hypothetical protein